ncbi:hypothetical protein B0T25DRAFT_265331 [Lasiosphaeria hispida]|uniref:Uncharacterized protein n=1 Tax=Lasiosphaeria hispida TaxID=260671 RepID=A0AAJ0HA84_9PEZI|nr:hypothetical protein B0T25DRAFT_265331 [Lasiosphaeria hispida]
MRDKFGRSEWDTRYRPVWRALWGGGAVIEPAAHQGPPFPRLLQYIASAIAETYTIEEEVKKAVQEYCQYIADIRKFHVDRAIESTAVRRVGRSWLGSIGRRLRRSLSPSPPLATPKSSASSAAW